MWDIDLAVRILVQLLDWQPCRGFRVQMQINLADQSSPITLGEWMSKYDGRGMDAFLADRMKSILISWKIVTIEKDRVQLTQGWGSFYGNLMNILNIILPTMRNR